MQSNPKRESTNIYQRKIINYNGQSNANQINKLSRTKKLSHVEIHFQTKTVM